MRKPNYETARFNLSLDQVAADTLKQLQEKTEISTVSELVRRAIRAYYMVVRLNEDGARIKFKDASEGSLIELL